MIKREYATISGIADAVIEELKKTNAPFTTPTIVFHNARIAQWFKAYYLKNSKGVLMNVRFEALGRFINGIINPLREHEIISRTTLREYILKVLTEQYHYDSADSSNPVNYIFDASGKLNGTNLYEFSDMLATLFMNYEYDEEEITGWQESIYSAALLLAETDNRYTTKSLFLKERGSEAAATSYGSLRDPVYIIDNSYISNLYETILDTLHEADVSVFTLSAKSEKDEPICDAVFSAPSIQREVEAVHSKICAIVRDNPNVRFNDFLVLIPDIDSYANVIDLVFRQDDINFPAIPYRIVGTHKEQGDIASALQVLCDVARVGYFTRFDLYRFVSNPMVKYIRDISDEEIDWWMSTLDATNTYRGGKEDNDWDYLKKRLLLSKLVSEDANLRNKTDMDGAYYLPYQLLGMDFSSTNKLIDIIDALQDWSGAFSGELNDILLTGADMTAMQGYMDALYSRKGQDGEELNTLYRTVLEENESLIEMGVTLPANTWLRLLQDAPSRYISHPADMFVGGVTFVDLSCDNIVAEPYIFVMGMSSQNFPRIDLKSEIDLSTSEKHRSSEMLDKLSIDNICGGKSHCVFSYVDRDLKKDSALYPSSLMPKLPAGVDPEKILLDEKRNYEQLFTKREFVNKGYFEKLTDTTKVAAASNLPSEGNLDISLTITDIKRFLENSFVYKFSRLLQKRNEDEDIVRKAFEPIDPSELTRYNVTRDITADGADKEDLVLKRTLPEKQLGDIYYDKYKAEAEAVRKFIMEENYHSKMLMPLSLTAEDKSGQAICWTLSCNVDMFAKEEDGTLCYIEPVVGKSDRLKDYFNAYAFSLMDIAQRKSDVNTTYHVELHVGGKDHKKYCIQPAKAKEILNQLYLK